MLPVILSSIALSLSVCAGVSIVAKSMDDCGKDLPSSHYLFLLGIGWCRKCFLVGHFCGFMQVHKRILMNRAWFIRHDVTGPLITRSKLLMMNNRFVCSDVY